MCYPSHILQSQSFDIRGTRIFVSVLALVFGLGGPSWGAEVCIQKKNDPTCIKIITVPDQAAAAMMNKAGFCVITSETCDGMDNDCDGLIDEDGAGNPLTQATTCGVGACSNNTGFETCSDGVFGNDTCDPVAGATSEVCNGLDNDCDGLTDEDGEGNPLTRPTTCGVGACAGNAGIETCTAGVFDNDTCDPFLGATAEHCDTLDNDCDGISDEDAAGNPLTQVTTCGVGQCAGNTGIETCTAGTFGSDNCDPLAGATAELCNGLDDNCDGTADEGGDLDCFAGIGECTPLVCGGVLGCIHPADDGCEDGRRCDIGTLTCPPVTCPCDQDLLEIGWEPPIEFGQTPCPCNFFDGCAPDCGTFGTFQTCRNDPVQYDESIWRDGNVDPFRLPSLKFFAMRFNPEGLICSTGAIERPVNAAEAAVCVTRFGDPSTASSCLGLSLP